MTERSCKWQESDQGCEYSQIEISKALRKWQEKQSIGPPLQTLYNQKLWRCRHMRCGLISPPGGTVHVQVWEPVISLWKERTKVGDNELISSKILHRIPVVPPYCSTAPQYPIPLYPNIKSKPVALHISELIPATISTPPYLICQTVEHMTWAKIIWDETPEFSTG